MEGTAQQRPEKLAFLFGEQAALISDQYKIYRTDEGASFELYDIINDPAEEVNLADRNPEKLNELVAQWQSWKTSQQASAHGKDY